MEKLENISNLECLQNQSTYRELIRLIILDYITLVRDFASLYWTLGKTARKTGKNPQTKLNLGLARLNFKEKNPLP
jgi:hypothetical protein